MADQTNASLESAPTPTPESTSTSTSNTTPTSSLPDPIFTTPRLLVRPLHPQDAPSMAKYAAPASVARYMSLAFSHPYTLQHAETWISMNLTPPISHFAMCEIARPDILIGGIGFKPGDDVNSHTAEIGYWLGDEFSGRGYTTEALEAMTNWTFTERGGTYRKLWAGVFGGHIASMRVLEKCGYEPEGIMRDQVEKHGEVMDLHHFGLTKRNWEAKRRETDKELK